MVSTKWSSHLYCKKSIDVLQEIFPVHLISLRGDIEWPARLLDLSSCDYFLWDYVKEEVYKHQPTTIDGLKAAIRQTMNEIPQEITRRVKENFRNCLHQCIAVRERHIENVIFKT